MRLLFLAIPLSLAGQALAADETPIPFFPERVQTCLGSGARTMPAEDATAQEVTLVRHGEPDPLSEVAAWNRLRAGAGLSPHRQYQPVWAAVRLRGESRPRLAHLGCQPGEGGVLSCGVDCDGGGVRVEQTGDTFALRSRGLRLGGMCGSSLERVWWKDGPHDTDFTLKRLDGPACTGIIESMRPAHANLGLPVMDRIAAGRSCFQRHYATAHLRRHAAQRVKTMRVDWKGFEADDGGRGRALVSVTLRTGATASEMLTCQAEGFAVQCFPAHGDGDMLLTRDKDRVVRLSMKGIEGVLDTIGGLSLGKADDVFLLEEAPCQAAPKRAGFR